MTRRLVIHEVVPESVAAELDLEPGDTVLAVDGRPVRDALEFSFLTAEPHVVLEVEKPNGEIWEIDLEREPGEELGVVLPPITARSCGNRCIFCFVDQMPTGMRRSLYLKDEDYRLSFLFGNFVTLSTVREADVERIVEQRLSPLYVSVHATDEGVRKALLGRKRLPAILPLLKRLVAAGIRVHAQIVLIPGINDGEILKKSIAELSSLSPGIESLAVVPIGLTRHREGLHPLRPVDGEQARLVIATAHGLRDRLPTGFLHLADEFYLKAQVPFPVPEAYAGFPQLENGVGMIPLFLAEGEEVLEGAEPLDIPAVGVVTGASFFPVLKEFLERLTERTGGDILPVRAVNTLFGESVTVAGLLPGRDVVDALKTVRHRVETAIIPDVMLRDREGLFLDDMTVGEVEKQAGIPLIVAASGPAGLWESLVALSSTGKRERRPEKGR